MKKVYDDYIKEQTLQIETLLNKQMLRVSQNVPIEIVDAMKYSLMAGGKRLRPLMLMEAAKACGLKNKDDSEVFACAIEMIHTSSLIHDDLPAMDNDDLRRGRPTSHKVYGEAMAILAGDALLNHASEIMSEYVSNHCEVRFAKAAYVINKVTGIRGMIGGQTIDILAEKAGKDIASYELLTKMYSMKTCALLEGAVEAGAYIAGANDETVRKWAEYALNLGLAFQITDDILDVVGDSNIIGKNVGSDANNDKPTFVTFVGVDGARSVANKYTEKAKSIAKEIGNAEFFVWIADYLCKRDR